MHHAKQRVVVPQNGGTEEAVARLDGGRDYIGQYAFTFTLLLNWGTVITICSAIPNRSCLGSSALPEERTGIRNVQYPQVS